MLRVKSMDTEKDWTELIAELACASSELEVRLDEWVKEQLLITVAGIIGDEPSDIDELKAKTQHLELSKQAIKGLDLLSHTLVTLKKHDPALLDDFRMMLRLADDDESCGCHIFDPFEACPTHAAMYKAHQEHSDA